MFQGQGILRRGWLVAAALVVAACDGTPSEVAPARAKLETQVQGVAPGLTVPGLQTTNEDSRLIFSTLNGNPVTVADDDGGIISVQVSATNGTFVPKTGKDVSITSTSGGQSVILTGPIAGLNEALEGAAFFPALNYYGAAELAFLLTDNTGGSTPGSVPISVTPFNDAPSNAVPTGMQAATEDVPKAINYPVVDVDILDGHVTVTLVSSNGTLITLPTTAGVTLRSGDTVTDSDLSFSGPLPAVNAVLNGLVITPPQDYIGTSTLVMTSTDVVAVGEGTPGTDTDTVTFSWAPVNDAPVNTVPGTQAIQEETPLTFSEVGGNKLSLADVDATTAHVQVSLSALGGTLTLGRTTGLTFGAGDGTADATLTFNGTLLNLNAALNGLVFTPAANFAGEARLTMQSNDLGNSGEGGALQDTDILVIQVAGVNDAPVVTMPGAQTTNEDVARAFSTTNNNVISVADVDAPTVQVTLSASEGLLTLSSSRNGLSYQLNDGTADATMRFTGAPAAVNAALNGLLFTPTPNAFGLVTITVEVTDLGATGSGPAGTDVKTVQVQVVSVNDAPDAVADVLTVDEDAPATAVAVLANDSVVPDSGETLTISAVTQGANGTVVNLGTSLTYRPAANFNGRDTFTYTVSDGNGGTDVATVAVTVNSVNDDPVATNDSFSVKQDVTSASLRVMDNDTATPDTGETLTLVSVSAPSRGGTATINGNAIAYKPAPTITGDETFTYTISDGRGGTAEATVTVTILAVYNAPVNTLPAPQQMDEDTGVTFVALNSNAISVADENHTSLTVSVAVSTGTFTLSGTTNLIVSNDGTAAVTLEGPITAINTALNGARYTPPANYSGTVQLTVNSADAVGERDTDTLALTVRSINDGPVNTVPLTATAVEDTPRTFSGLQVNDVDVGSGNVQLTLTANNDTLVSLASTAGLAFSVGDGRSDATMTFVGTPVQISTALNGMTVVPPPNYVGPSTLTFVSNDLGNTGAGGEREDIDEVTITWATANDTPVQVVPGPQTIAEEGLLTFSSTAGTGLSVTDADLGAAQLRVTLSSTGGRVSLGNPAAVSLVTGTGTLDTSVAFTGTQAQVNTALEGSSFTPNTNFVGSAGVTLLTSDQGNTGGAAQTDSDTVTVNVTGVNDAPVNTVPGPQAITEDTTLAFSAARGNAVTVADVDATSLQVTLSAVNGALTITPGTGLTFQVGDGTADATMTFTGLTASVKTALDTLRFTPAANFDGGGSVTILTADLGATGEGGALTDLDTVPVSVTPVNDNPTAVADTLTVEEDAVPTLVDVLANDSNVDSGETLTLTAVTTPTRGTATIQGGQVLYQPNPNANGTDTFSYTISDGRGGVASATVTVTVTSVNDAPTAVDDTLTVVENAAATTVPVLTNDTFAPDTGETLTITATGPAAHGTVVLAADGRSLTYRPTPAYNGPDAFSYTIGDGRGGSATAQVRITVTPFDYTPTAVADTLSVPEDGSRTLEVLANDTNLGNAPITVVIKTPPAQGTAVVVTGNAILYTPNANYRGADTFAYTLTDSDGDTASANVSVTVTGVNDVPVAVADSATTPEDTSVRVDVKANDQSLFDTPVTVTVTQAPAHGTTTIDASGAVTYRPAANYAGDDVFQYTVTDQDGELSRALVNLTVTPVNDPPVNTVPTTTQAAVEDTPKTFTGLQVNDVDVGSGTLQLMLTADNDTRVTLPSITGLAFSEGDGTSDTTMTFVGTTVQISAALNGLTVTPPTDYSGPSTLRFVSNDLGNTGAGGAREDIDVLTINWVAANDAPVQVVPGAQTTPEETPLAFSSATSTGLSVTDADVGAGQLRVTLSATNALVSLGDRTAVTLVTGTGTLDTSVVFTGTQAQVNTALEGSSLTPNLNFVGNAVLTLSTSDQGNTGGAARTDSDTVTVAVSAVNDAPVNTVPISQAIAEDGTLAFSTALGNAISAADVDATSLQVTLTGLNGTVSLGTRTNLTFQVGDGVADATTTFTGLKTAVNTALNTLSFKPSLNFGGGGSVTILTSDLGATGVGGELFDTDTVLVTVTPVNDNPTVLADVLTVLEDAAATRADVLANDSSAPDEGETLTITAVTTPARGTATLQDGQVFYQPNANANGTDSFSYTVSDGKGGVGTATVTVSVTPVNDAPTAVADTFTIGENAVATAVPVLTNDSFAPDTGETLTITAAGPAANGIVVVATGGKSLTYQPNTGFNGADTFNYTIGDGNGGEATAQVRVTVTPFDYTPVAVADTLTVDEDSNRTLDVLANDTNISNAPITVTIKTPPTQGTASVVTGNGILYTPNANYRGADSFVYTLTDADGDTASATVTVTVTGVNDLPLAVADSATTPEDTSVRLAVMGNDQSLFDTPVTVAVTQAPAHGTTKIEADNAVTYQPAANYHGEDTFLYTLTDADGQTSSALVSITVTPVNDAPVATADAASTRVGVAVEVDVLANDTDADGDTLTLASITTPTSGTATLTAAGRVSYTPPAAFTGNAQLTYTVRDPSGLTAVGNLVVGVGLDTDGDGLADVDELALGTDPRNPDTDGDGLPDPIEANVTKTNPLDADMDDDGLTDGNEDTDKNGVVAATETDPKLADTDADGLQDGTELGLIAPQKTPGTSASVFVPDLHPASKTNPRLADTDSGGLADGVEDANHNGRVDAGETDPNLAKDDKPTAPDRDSDGVPDATDNCPTLSNAGQGDADKDGTGDACEPREPTPDDGGSSGGGGCSTAAGGAGSSPLVLALLLLALTALWRRRTRA